MNSMTVLKECDIFRELSVPLPDVTLEPPVAYAKGSVIYDQQHTTSAMGILVRGKAVASPLGQTGGLLTRFAPGSVFGVAAVFGAPDSFVSRITAQTDCLVQFVPESALRRIFTDCPQAAVAYITFLSRKIRFLNGKLAALSQTDGSAKVYAWLLQNCDETGTVSGYTMSDIAKILSVGRTSLYRALEGLEQNHMIVRRDRKIQVIE